MDLNLDLMILTLLLIIPRLLFIYWLFYSGSIQNSIQTTCFSSPCFMHPSFIWSSFIRFFLENPPITVMSILQFLCFLLFYWDRPCSVRTVTLGELLLSKWANISALCCTELSVMKKTTTDWSCYLREVGVNYTCVLLILVITSSHD